jgi:hypothetical protein
MIATGRHTIANAEPSSNPLDRVTLDKYNPSAFDTQRPRIVQYASGVTSHSPIRPP